MLIYIAVLAFVLVAIAFLGFVKPQPACTVLIRCPGKRRFSKPLAAKDTAALQWEYALMAENAYRDKWHGASSSPELAHAVTGVDGKATREYLQLGAAHRSKVHLNRSTKPDKTAALPLPGWLLWVDYPGKSALRDVANTQKLYFEVWQKGYPGTEVAIVFRGTVARYWNNWLANFRWVIRFATTSYDVTQSSVAPDLAAQLLVRRLEGTLKSDFTLTAVGHSLGGGLAQQLAYSLPTFEGVSGGPIPCVARIYAFDSSPVTGWAGVTNKIQRAENVRQLSTYRIYERGEILAYLRLLWSYVVPPSISAPAITEMRYNFQSLKGDVAASNPIAQHSMLLLMHGICKEAGIDHASDGRQPRTQ